MKKMGGANHLKRHPAPVFWPIHRKKNIWTIKPKAGTHSVEKCIPLLLIVRDQLNLANSNREAKKIISKKEILIDGRFIIEHDFPVGLMDVLEIPKINEAYRILPSQKDFLKVHKIKKSEIGFKLFKINGKTILKNNQLQLNFHDGQNIIINSNKTKVKEKEYMTSDVLKINLKKKKVLDHVKIKNGTVAIMTGGKNVGVWGKIKKIKKGKGSNPTIVTLEGSNEKKVQTTTNNVFLIGHEKPWISLPEERERE
jgi:small subunit ribosomal protein S4e